MKGIGGIRFLSFFVLLLICGFQMGCAKGLNGTIYLDENGNTKHDKDEVLLAGLNFTVTLDDKEIDQGITAADGTYDVKMDGSGKYCVVVSESDLVSSTNVTQVVAYLVPYYHLKTQAIQFAKKIWNFFPISEAMATAVADSESTEALCSNGINDDTDTDIDCNDTQCVSLDACALSKCIAEDNKTDGKPDCVNNPSICSTADVCKKSSSTTTTETTAVIVDRKACDTTKGLVLTLDVPVAVDYQATVDLIKPTETVILATGEDETLNITYPKSCKLNDIKLPEYAKPAQDDIYANAYSPETHILDFQAAIDLIVLCNDSTPSSAEQDTRRTCDLVLGLEDDGIIGDESEDFKPTVTCNDDKTYNLTAFTIKKEGSSDLEVLPTFSLNDVDIDLASSSGDIATITFTVNNNSTIDLASTDFDFKITTPGELTSDPVISITGESTACTGDTCNFDLNAGDTKDVIVTFTLPGMTSATTLTTTATLTFNNGASASITKEKPINAVP